MDIKAWSNLIYKYYFERNLSERVILHISMQDLIDFAKDEDVEIANGKYASTFDDLFIRNDFARKFWLYQDGNKNLSDLQKKINQIANQAINEKNYFVLLSVLAVLIMPICENDEIELHGRDYYGHLFPFLHNNNFIKGKNDDTGRGGRNFLGTIHLDRIWQHLDKWAADNNLNFKSNFVVSDNGANQYALSLMKESLLSPSKIQRFGVLFDKAGLVPRANIEDTRLFSAFSNYYLQIGISISKFKSLTGPESREYLSSVLRSEYNRWDGTTRIKERDRRTGKIRVEAGNTCYPLLLLMDYDLHSNNCTFAFQLYCSDIEDMEYMNFVADINKNKFAQVYIKTDGYANQPFRLDENEIKMIFSSRQGIYGIHEENDKSLKGRHVVTDYYLLRQYKNKYIATNDFVKGDFYFAIIRHDASDEFSPWLKANEATLIKDNALGGVYSVYRIENAIEELPNKNSLRFKNDIRCKSINNLEVKIADDTEVVYLSKLLPAQFEITGVDVSKDKIYAISVNDPHRNVSELEYDHNKKLWILKVFTNLFQIQKEFQLYCNEEPIPYGRTYKFVDFVLPSQFKELSLDQWGGQSDNPLSTGLELSKDIIGKNLINWFMLNMRMQAAKPSEINTSKYMEKDFLLYSITSASYETRRWVINMPWLKDIRDRLSSEFENDDVHTLADKYSLTNALADYFRMGYINYVYTDGVLHLTANRPTLILLTPKFKQIVTPGIGGRNMKQFVCEEKHYKCLLTGGRTIALVREIEKYQKSLGYQVEYLEATDYLQPQTIYIHAANRSIFKALASKCNLLYQDNIYANALIEALPSVKDYIIAQKNNNSRDLLGVPSFRAIDYSKMAVLYPEKLAQKRAIANYEIDKDSYNSQNDVVTFFPGSRDETTIMIDEGNMVEIDKYWGYFVGMYKANAKILQYNEDSVQVSLPHQFRLPLLYARALTLLNGSTPNSVIGSRTYCLDVNPYTFGSQPKNILNKLGQL